MRSVGAVVIGRNEGDRFRRCLESLVGKANPIVYVDSGSTDGSIDYARDKGADVIELDASLPFTAARARNAGFEEIMRLQPQIELVMFVDGDCEVHPDWLQPARRFLLENTGYGVVCGRRRERHPTETVYNYLCDAEWDTPVGDARACGGDAMMRAEAFAEVNGFNPSLIAGEEPELCVRLRRAGWKIRRIDQDMTLHDANLTRFTQWWARAMRGGHAYAEGAAMHGAPPERHCVAESRRAVVWGLVLPGVAVLGAPLTAGASILLLVAYPLNIVRVAWRLRGEGEARPWTVASLLQLAKLPEAVGWLRFRMGRLTGKRSGIIEYKAR